MSQYLLPDLTGENALYKISNDVKRIIKQDQVVSLYDSVFKDTLVITLLGTTNNKDTGLYKIVTLTIVQCLICDF